MKKYRVGLVIGRFQPFHLGHKYLLEKALEYCDEIIVGIGSSNVTNENNPYSFETRKKFVDEFIKKSKIEARISKIIYIEDVPDDRDWLDLLLKKTGKVDVEIGDNEWTNGIFENAQIPVVRIGHYKREILEGVKIRNNMKNKLDWKDRVPEYLVKYIEKNSR